MRWVLLVVLPACGPQFEMDLFVRPDRFGLGYRSVDCKPRNPPLAPGQCHTRFYLEGDVRPEECIEDCLDVRQEGDEFVIFGCGGEARAPAPASIPAAPVVSVTRETTRLIVDASVELPTFRYSYLCGSDVTSCLSAASAETFTVPCTTQVSITAQALSDERDTELGALRVWAADDTIVEP